MANIQPYLDNIANAEYGEEVRESICDAIEVINEEVHTGMSETFDSALTDRSAIKNAIFTGGWYDVPEVGNTISAMTVSSTFVCAVLPVEFGDYVFVNARGGGSSTAGARTYAFTDANGIIISRAGQSLPLNKTYLIAPQGSKYFYIQNSLEKMSSGYYAYVGYNIECEKGNIRKLEHGANVFTDYKPGYYSMSDNANFPNRIKTANDIESLLFNVTPGDVYLIQGSTKPAGSTNKLAETIVFDSSGNVLASNTSWVESYVRSIHIPENGAYLATNTVKGHDNSFAAKFNDANFLYYTMLSTGWESGGISDAGKWMTNLKRICNIRKIALYRNKNIEIVLPDGFVGLVYKYDELGGFIAYQLPWSNKIKFSDLPSNTCYINIVVRSESSPDTDISDKVSYIAKNTIIREKTNTEEIEIKDVQKITTTINYYPEEVLTGKTLDENGAEVSNASYKVTDFVKIPKKYNKLLLYTHAFSESGNAPIVAFYDSAMTFIEKVTTDTDCVANDDSYTYARAVFPVADAKCDLSFSNETIKPDYAPPKKYLLFTNDLNSYDRNVISDGVVGAIINTGLKYLGDEQFGYGTEHTAFAESCIKTTKDTHTSSSGYDGERYQMDCSTYVLLMMMGITPKCSRYFYTKNIPSNWGYRFNRLIEYEGYVYGIPQTGDTKRLYANSIADYAYKNGYLFLVNDDLSNIRPGDIFFLSNQGASYNFFENIGHCGMIVDSIQMENGGRTIVTFEGNGGSSSPCKFHTYTSRSASMIYAARFPMPFVHNDANDVADFSEAITTALTGVSGDTIDIATIEISKPLENGKVYTVCVKCDLPNNCYLKLKDNGMSHMGVANENILKRPDGYRTFHIFAKNSDTISTTGSITIQAKCTGSVSGSAVLSMVRVYDGFVSPEFT